MQSSAVQGEFVTLNLLKGFRVDLDGRTLGAADWLGRRAAELVQLLALQPHHSLDGDQVVDALWPDLDPAAGHANLRKAAHLARQSAGDPEAVVLRAGRVLLFPKRELHCDLQRFNEAATMALASGDPAACTRAAAFYSGELLPEARYQPWTEAPRERAREQYLALLRQAGDHERLLQEDPGDEAACRALMEAALATGRRSVALRRYATLRDHLAQDIGVRPGPATEAVYRRCLDSQEPAAQEFVGRTMELARGLGWLGEASGRLGGALVRGAAGMGKSALLSELAREAERLGWRVVRAQAHDSTQPCGLIADVVAPLLASDAGVLARLGPNAHGVLAAITPLAQPAPALPGPVTRHQVVGAVQRLLAHLGDQRVLFVVDDLHRADEGSADTVLQLAATSGPLFVLMGCRSGTAEALERGLSRLVRRGRVELLELGPLSPADAANLARRAASPAVSEDALASVLALAEGHPFALLELAQAASHPRRGAAQSLPAGVAAAIRERLYDVDAPTLDGLQRLALAGAALEVNAVMALLGGDEAACDRLDRALASGLLVVVDGRYRFAHALLGHALVDSLAPHQRIGLHRDVALRLTPSGASPGLLAQHWLAAGEAAQARPWALEAARRAQRLGSFVDVLRHVEPLLAALPNEPEALSLRAEAIDGLGLPGALGAYDAAAAVAVPEQAHELRAKRALAQVKMSDPQGALQYLKDVRPTTVAGKLAEALAYSGAAALGYGDPAEGTRRAAESRRLALASGDTGSLVIASWAQAAAAHARGELHSSVWADLHESAQFPHLAVRVFDGHLCITQRFLYGSRPYRDVIAFADGLAAEARKLGAERGHAFAVTLRGEAELLSGQLDAAERDLVEGGRLHRAIGGATGEALALQRRAELALYRGRREAAGGLLDEALDLARQSDVGFHLLDRIYGTRIAVAADEQAALGELEEAAAAVRGPFETCPGCRITFAMPATIAAARAHEHALASQHEQAADYLANVVMKLPAWHAALHEARAHMALAKGQRDAAHAGFAAAAQAFAAAEHPLDQARCSVLARG